LIRIATHLPCAPLNRDNYDEADVAAVADQEILKGVGEGGRQCISPSSFYVRFIANAHNELYDFYTGKCGFLKK